MTDADALLARLLGPAVPELTCEECFAALDEHVEVQRSRGAAIAASVHPGMAAHLEGCPACAEDHADLHAWLEALDPTTR